MATTTEEKTKPLTRQELSFISAWRKYRHLGRAAEKARIAKNQVTRTFNRPEIQDEIERQDEAVRQERAKLEVKAEALTNELIDRELAAMIQLDAKDHGSLKLDAIRTGLVVNGRIQSGTMRSLEVFRSQENRDGDTTGAPNVYQAMVTVSQAPAPILPEDREQSAENRGQGTAGTVRRNPLAAAAPQNTPAPQPTGTDLPAGTPAPHAPRAGKMRIE